MTAQAFMVWDKQGDCITGINWDRARLEAPLKEDGRPDMSKRMLYGVVVTYKPECGRIEIRK